MKYRKLSELCEYASDKILVSILSRQNYISTENMLQNRGGISLFPTSDHILRKYGEQNFVAVVQMIYL